MAAVAVAHHEAEKGQIAMSGRIATLDGVRAAAILLVVIGHATNTIGQFSTTPLGKIVGAAGYLGVDIFFVLSGFLITSLLLKERATTGRISLVRFYERRLRRIFPAYWVFSQSWAFSPCCTF